MWAAAVQSWRDLDGLTVTGWHGVEMALYGGEDGEPEVFADPRIPFRQFWTLDPVTAAGTRRIASYQNDTAFGLHVAPAEPLIEGAATGIFRSVAPDLPIGRIEGVTVVEEDDVVAEVTFTVGGAPVLLLAGEVEPAAAGRLELVRHDESVLVFTDPADADRLTWRPPRAPRPQGSARG